MIIEESKDRYIRVLEYKYMRVCMQMEVKIKPLSLNNIHRISLTECKEVI
jgi:hypothetical protein